MRRLWLSAALFAAAVPPASAQSAVVMPQAAAPQQPSMLDLNLMEALAAVGAPDLTGVFSFVPDQATPLAFAGYLIQHRKALKRFIKKGTRDLKQTGGVNAWDKLVFAALIQMQSATAFTPGVERLSKTEEYDVSGLVLARGMTLEEMNVVRGMKK